MVGGTPSEHSKSSLESGLKNKDTTNCFNLGQTEQLLKVNKLFYIFK